MSSFTSFKSAVLYDLSFVGRNRGKLCLTFRFDVVEDSRIVFCRFHLLTDGRFHDLFGSPLPSQILFSLILLQQWIVVPQFLVDQHHVLSDLCSCRLIG